MSLLHKCSLESYICVNIWAWSYICHSEQHPQMYTAFHRVQNSNADMTECVCEYHPTVNLPFLQFRNSNTFQYVILKKLKWNETTYILIIHKYSKQYLQHSLQDLSMQLHGIWCRHEYMKSCEPRHAWFTNLSTETHKMLTSDFALEVSMQRNIKKLPSGLFAGFH